MPRTTRRPLADRLAALDGFPGAHGYRAFVLAVAEEEARIITEEDPPGATCGGLYPDRHQLAEVYAAEALVLVKLAARAATGAPNERGKAAGLLFGLLADDRSPSILPHGTLLVFLGLLPDDGPAGILRGMLAAARVTQRRRWCGFPYRWRGWRRALRPTMQDVVAAMGPRAGDVDALRAALLTLAAADRIELVTEFCTECGGHDPDGAHNTTDPRICPTLARGKVLHG